MPVTPVSLNNIKPYATLLSPLQQAEWHTNQEESRATYSHAKPRTPQKPVVDIVTFSSEALKLAAQFRMDKAV